MNRRQFLRLMSRGAMAGAIGGGIYGAFEAKRLQVTRMSICIPNLPRVFDGMRIAFLSDLHHSAVVPASFIQHAVELTNELDPDVVILGGDYVTAGLRYAPFGTGRKYVAPCFELLKNLRARRGVFAVTGNHDTRAGIPAIHAAIDAAGF